MHLHLGGHLAWYDAQKRARFEIYLAEPIGLCALAQQLGIPPAEIAVAAINGRVVALDDARVRDDDCVELFPPVGGGGTSSRFEVRGSKSGVALRTLNLKPRTLNFEPRTSDLEPQTTNPKRSIINEILSRQRKD